MKSVPDVTQEALLATLKATSEHSRDQLCKEVFHGDEVAMEAAVKVARQKFRERFRLKKK